MKKFLILSLLFAFNAQATEPDLIEKYDNWSAYYYNDGVQKVCYMSANPTQEEGKYTSRQDTYITISNRPNDKTKDVFSLTSGYIYKVGAPVVIKVGDQTIDRTFSDKNKAWAINQDVDKEIIDAFKRGLRVIVHGTTKDGVKTKDTYSLQGFNEAYQAINHKCK